MSVRSIKARMHEAVEALPDDVRFSSSENDIAAMKGFLQAIYSELSSYAYHCGAENDDIQNEAVPACDVIDSAFYKQMREREFAGPAPGQPYSALNHRQQFGSIVEGAQL